MKNILKISIVFIIVVSTTTRITYADDLEKDEEKDINDEYAETVRIIDEINEQTENEKESSYVSNNLYAEPVINSRKCVIYDRKSKRVIYGKNENIKCAMASTTKIMTAIVVLENAELNKEVTIGKKAAGTGGSRLGLNVGDKITIKDLLYGLLLRSGNDAAVALAIEIGESIEGFAEMMNNKAKEIKLKNTNFVTPHGLDNAEHYTTATELAILTDYALSNELFKKIVGTKNYTITINGYSKNLNNTNELLGVIDGVVGVKTGFTNGAGRCLVANVVRENRDFITVVLGADTKKDRTKDSIKLINYAFNCFKEFNLQEKTQELFDEWVNINSKRITLIKAQNSKLLLKLSELENKKILLRDKDISNIEYEINTITTLIAPISSNTKVGTIIIKLKGEIIDQVDIIIVNNIERMNWDDYLVRICRRIRDRIM